MITNLETERVTRSQAERWGTMFEHKPIPIWKNKLEAQKWAKEEERRWFEGYSGMSGMYYKYLTQYKIKDSYGKMIKPLWRDGDHFLVSTTTEKCLTYNLDKFTLKRREYGLSGWDGGFVPLEIAARNPGCVINLTSYNEAQLSKLMNQKISAMASAMYSDSEKAWKVMFGENAKLWKPETKYTTTGSGKLVFMHSKDTLDHSTIYGVQTSQGKDAAKNMEGDRLGYAFIDEFFRHPNPTDVLQSADGSRKAGLRNASSIFLGGSAGDSTQEGSSKAQELWSSHAELGIEIVFLPSTLCIAEAEDLDDHGIKINGQYVSFMVNGWSIQDEAEEWVHKKRKVLKSLRDKTAYWQFVKAYPLSPDEIFEVNTQTSWNDDEKSRFSEQRKKIYEAPNKFKHVSISESNQKDVYEFRERTNGHYKILEEPIRGEIYLTGIDPIPFSGKELSEGNSDFAAVVHRLSTSTDVAYYRERNLDSDMVAYRLSTLQKAYNNSIGLIERDRGDTIIDKYKTLNLSYLLLDEPYIWRPQNQKLVHKGYMKRGKESQLIDNFLLWVRHFDEVKQTGGIESIWDLELLDQYFAFHIGNKDLADAKQAVELLKWWYKEYQRRKEEFSKQSDDYVKKVPVKMFIGGRLVVKYVEVKNASQNLLGKGYESF